MEELKEQLVPHARAEEKSLYLAMKNSNDKQAEVLGVEGDFEHQLVDQLIKELDVCITTSPTWEAKLSILKNNLDHHIQEEEKVVFPTAEATFSTPKLDLILDEFRDLKEKSEHFNDHSKKKPTDEAVQISFS